MIERALSCRPQSALGSVAVQVHRGERSTVSRILLGYGRPVRLASTNRNGFREELTPMSASSGCVQETFDWEHVYCWSSSYRVVGMQTLRDVKCACFRFEVGVWCVVGRAALYSRYYVTGMFHPVVITFYYAAGGDG